MRFLVLIASLAVAGPPSPLEALGRFDPRAVPEASGIVKSRRHPEIFWVHNDSGNPPALFAIRRDGTIVREFRLAVPNIDWEDIAADDDGHLYVGDIGNNGSLLAIRAIYRIDEPDPGAAATGPLRPRSASFYRLPKDDRFDAEGLFVDGGSAIVVSKRHDGREAELFAVPLEPPAPLLRPAAPRPIGVLPGFVEPATGASLSPDGKLLAVSSYAVLRVYRRARDRPWDGVAEVRYDPSSVEGIAWDGLDLILVSEGRGVDRVAEAVWKSSTFHAKDAALDDVSRKDAALEDVSRKDAKNTKDEPLLISLLGVFASFFASLRETNLIDASLRETHA
jgi:hypothetical protein